MYINDRYGGVAFRIVVCVASLLILGGAIVVLLKTFESGKADDLRKAEIICAYGIQEAFNKLAESIEWDAGFKDESYPFAEEGEGGGTYSVTVTRETRGDSLYIKIVSTGTVGSISQTQTDERVIPLGHLVVDGGVEDTEDGLDGDMGESSGEGAGKNSNASGEDIQ